MISIQPGQNGNIPYRLEAYTYGGSIVIRIRASHTELFKQLGLFPLKEADGPDKIPLSGQPESGPYGDYISIWNPDKQPHGEREYDLEALTHGGSVVVKIPAEHTELIDTLGLSKLKDADGPNKIELYGQAETGQFGDYLSLWNPEQQAGGDA